jgi:hypothetical protein
MQNIDGSAGVDLYRSDELTLDGLPMPGHVTLNAPAALRRHRGGGINPRLRGPRLFSRS